MPPSPATHVPPQNIEDEESVLGAMLVAEPALTRVIDEVKLNAADFYLDRHRAIFECAHDLYAESKPVDELSVAAAAPARGRAGDPGLGQRPRRGTARALRSGREAALRRRPQRAGERLPPALGAPPRRGRPAREGIDPGAGNERHPRPPPPH